MIYTVVYVKDRGNGEKILMPLKFFADYKDASKCMNDARVKSPSAKVAIVDADSVVWFGNDLEGLTVYIERE